MSDGRSALAMLVRLIVQLLILAVVNLIVIELPMLKSITIPGSPVAIAAIVSCLIGIIMITVLLLFRQDFLPLLRRNYKALPQAVTIASSAILLAIFITAYSTFGPLVTPLLSQYAWVYPVLFLILVLWPLYVLAAALFSSSGTIADWATEKIRQKPQAGPATGATCASCGHECVPGAKFCTSCGVCLIPPTENKVFCKACGAVNRCTYKYCLNCGVRLEDDQFETRVSI